MAALTPTKVALTELSGDQKLYIATVTPTTASDTVTFVAATHKFRKIYGVWGQIVSGMGTTFLALQISFSGLVVTIVSKGQDGNDATAWGVVRLLVAVGSAD